MIGVNIDNLEALIKKNNNYLSFYNDDSRRLIDSISELSSCYSGSSIQYLFNEPMNEIENIKSISKIIENYTDVLYSVKISYQQQDLNLKSQVNHINSKLQ